MSKEKKGLKTNIQRKISSWVYNLSKKLQEFEHLSRAGTFE